MGTDNPQLEAKVRDLNEQLEKARKAYYVDATPIMTDAAFDVLEGRLRGLIQTSPWLAYLATSLSTVGSDATGKDRIKHIRPMLSIENQYKKEDVVAFFLELQPKKG